MPVYRKNGTWAVKIIAETEDEADEALAYMMPDEDGIVEQQPNGPYVEWDHFDYETMDTMESDD